MKPSRDPSAFGSSSKPHVPVSAVSPSDITVDLIRGMIYSGELTPGDWLPPLRELADHLGISVLTLRVALKSLEGAGFIVTTRGAHGGSRVGDIQTLTRCWTDWMHDTGDEIDDLWEFREILETNIASLAAQRRSEAELRAIEAAWAAAATDSHTAFLRWNAVFHDALAEASHSPHLAGAMRAVRRELFLPVGLLLRTHRAEELRDSHTQILEAVRGRLADEAAEAMRTHLDGTRLMVGEVLEEGRAHVRARD
jgi:GntR family transcriptional regulator, transcriptional repressor for pyruvate dehydrogenase complex